MNRVRNEEVYENFSKGRSKTLELTVELVRVNTMVCHGNVRRMEERLAEEVIQSKANGMSSKNKVPVLKFWEGMVEQYVKEKVGASLSFPSRTSWEFL